MAKILLEVEIPNGLTRVWPLFRLLQRLLKFLFQKRGSIFLRFHRLLKDRFPPVVLFSHRFGSRFHIVKHLRLYSRGVSDNGAGLDVDFEQSASARAGHIEVGRLLRHQSESYRKIELGTKGQPRRWCISLKSDGVERWRGRWHTRFVAMTFSRRVEFASSS